MITLEPTFRRKLSDSSVMFSNIGFEAGLSVTVNRRSTIYSDGRTSRKDSSIRIGIMSMTLAGYTIRNADGSKTSCRSISFVMMP